MPYYCETALNAIGTFPAEPINALTSLFPVAAGALALLQILRQGGAGPAALLLAVLAILTGLGSTAWHALRTPLALTLDTAPGVIYFLVVVLAWPWLLRRIWLGPALLAAFALVIWAMTRVSPGMAIAVAAVVLAIALAAGLMLVLTWREAGPAFRPALAMVGCAAVAAAFRSLDSAACAVVPFGSHFLWHIFLGTAAYFGVHMAAALWRLRRTQGGA